MTLKSDVGADNITTPQFEITRDLDSKITFSSKYDYPFVVDTKYLENAIVITQPYKVTAALNFIAPPIYNIVATTRFGNSRPSILILRNSIFTTGANIDFNDPRKVLPHVYVRIKNVPAFDSTVWRPLSGGIIIRAIHDPIPNTAGGQGVLYNNDWSQGGIINQQSSGYYGGQVLSSSYSNDNQAVSLSISMFAAFNIINGGSNFPLAMTTSLGEIPNIFANGPAVTTTPQDWTFNANVSIDVFVAWIR